MNARQLIFSAVLLIVGVGLFARRRRGPLRIDESGILVSRSLAKPLYLTWGEIDCFGVASVSEIRGGLCQRGLNQYVGVRLTDSSDLKTTRACADNRRLSDYDVLLTPDRGMSVAEFAAYLEKERIKFKEG